MDAASGTARNNSPHSEPAVGMLEGYFTERHGIMPSVL